VGDMQPKKPLMKRLSDRNYFLPQRPGQPTVHPGVLLFSVQIDVTCWNVDSFPFGDQGFSSLEQVSRKACLPEQRQTLHLYLRNWQMYCHLEMKLAAFSAWHDHVRAMQHARWRSATHIQRSFRAFKACKPDTLSANLEATAQLAAGSQENLANTHERHHPTEGTEDVLTSQPLSDSAETPIENPIFLKPETTPGRENPSPLVDTDQAGFQDERRDGRSICSTSLQSKPAVQPGPEGEGIASTAASTHGAIQVIIDDQEQKGSLVGLQRRQAATRIQSGWRGYWTRKKLKAVPWSLEQKISGEQSQLGEQSNLGRRHATATVYGPGALDGLGRCPFPSPMARHHRPGKQKWCRTCSC
jgi:IQ calmodulin-binding motif